MNGLHQVAHKNSADFAKIQFGRHTLIYVFHYAQASVNVTGNSVYYIMEYSPPILSLEHRNFQ